MFLHLSDSHSVDRGKGVYNPLGRHLPRQTSPRADTPRADTPRADPLGRCPPPADTP